MFPIRPRELGVWDQGAERVRRGSQGRFDRAGSMAVRHRLVGRVPALPRPYLSDTLRDKWGLPTVTLDCGKANEPSMRKDMTNAAAEMLERAGLRNVAPLDDGRAPGLCIHEMRTARMGPRTEDVGAERREPGARGDERPRHRPCVRDVGVVRQSVADLHGVDRPRLRPRNQQAEPVTRISEPSNGADRPSRGRIDARPCLPE